MSIQSKHSLWGKVRDACVRHKRIFGLAATRKVLIDAGFPDVREPSDLEKIMLTVTLNAAIDAWHAQGEAEYASWIERLKADADPGNLRLYADT